MRVTFRSATLLIWLFGNKCVILHVFASTVSADLSAQA